IVATGRDQGGRFYWMMRPALREAVVRLGLLPDTGELYPEVVGDHGPPLMEGTMSRIVVNAYERNPVARRRCIEHHGSSCTVCGFDFGAFYGPIAAGVIHVHHLRPVSSEPGESRVVDPIEDLRPVCPNCHVVLHRREPPLSIDGARAVVAGRGGVDAGPSGKSRVTSFVPGEPVLVVRRRRKNAGIARIQNAGLLPGTERCMPKEQFDGDGDAGESSRDA